jgi:predicted transcriptional regulator
MSAATIEWAKRQRVSSPETRRLLLAMAARAEGDKHRIVRSVPLMAEIAKEADIRLYGVHARIRTLIAQGLVQVGGKGDLTSIYLRASI